MTKIKRLEDFVVEFDSKTSVIQLIAPFISVCDVQLQIYTEKKNVGDYTIFYGTGCGLLTEKYSNLCDKIIDCSVQHCKITPEGGLKVRLPFDCLSEDEKDYWNDMAKLAEEEEKNNPRDGVEDL